MSDCSLRIKSRHWRGFIPIIPFSILRTRSIVHDRHVHLHHTDSLGSATPTMQHARSPDFPRATHVSIGNSPSQRVGNTKGTATCDVGERQTGLAPFLPPSQQFREPGCGGCTAGAWGPGHLDTWEPGMGNPGKRSDYIRACGARGFSSPSSSFSVFRSQFPGQSGGSRQGDQNG